MKLTVRTLTIAVASLSLGGCAATGDTDETGALSSAISTQRELHASGPRHFRPRLPSDGDGETETDPSSPAGTSTSTVTPPSYHGGPVILGTTRVYYIFYGNWSFGTATSATNRVLEDFARNVGGSSYYAINTTYPTTQSGTRQYVSNAVALGGSYLRLNTASSVTLTGTDVANIVKESIDRGALPIDTHGVYFVVAAPNVTESGHCTTFCGWHDHGTINGLDLKYSFIGNAGRCLANCAASQNQTVSPNGNPVADAMVNTIAHELDEAVTDPDINAWYADDGNRSENGDLCNWNFGTTYATANGARANVRLGSRDFLVQRNWVRNAFSPTQGCAISYP